MLKGALLNLASQRRVYRFVMGHELLNSMAWRYVAGEECADGIAVAEALNTQRLKVSLDHLGESVTNADEARYATEDYMQLLDSIAADSVDANVSVKLTQLGLDVAPELCQENLRHLLAGAAERENFVRIDMESSAYTQRTLDIHARLWSEGFRNVGVVLQAYLYRTANDVDRAIANGVRVRLCKGAYLEPPEIAWPNKAGTDVAFARYAEKLLMDGTYPAIATHDVRLIQHVRRFANQHRIGPERYEFQMLFGIRRDLQLDLVKRGYNVRVYVPYGSQWYPYLMRRMAERPANLGFFIRSFVREAMSRDGR